MASRSGQKHETVVEIEESVEATAQSKPAERPGGSREPRVRIPKVPEGHRYGGRDAYEPSIISIGPYHYGKPRLLPMESLKRQCFYELTERTDCDLDECFKELERMEARTCYPENRDHIKGKDFLEMMMLDACFIIQYLAGIQNDTLLKLLGGRIWVDTAIRNDLLLLENQIPFFIVMKVFSFFQLGGPDELMVFVDHFCRHVSPINTNQYSSYYFPKFTDTDSELGHLGSKHLLHFYRSFLFHRQGNKSDLNTALPYAEKPICTIRSATFLEEAGIKLVKLVELEERELEECLPPKKKWKKWLEQWLPQKKQWLEQRQIDSDGDCAMNVAFKNGIMEITPLFMDAFTVSQFRNLIALEKHDSSLEPQATAFAQFMDYIINTSKDVDLLRKKGILDHSLGSDEEIATLFNQLTSGILEYRTLELEEMYKDVDKYCKKKASPVVGNVDERLFWQSLDSYFLGGCSHPPFSHFYSNLLFYVLIF